MTTDEPSAIVIYDPPTDPEVLARALQRTARMAGTGHFPTIPAPITERDDARGVYRVRYVCPCERCAGLGGNSP